MLLFRLKLGLLGAYRISFHWITEALICNITREIFHWTSEAKKLMSPAPHSCSDPTSDINDTYVEKTPRKSQFGKKSAKVNHCLYSSTEQLQVAL
jgi:hypothetical protein